MGMRSRDHYLGVGYSLPQVDRIWLWVYCNKIPIYPIFYLLKETNVEVGLQKGVVLELN